MQYLSGITTPTLASVSDSDESAEMAVKKLELEKQTVLETARDVDGTARRPPMFDDIDEKKVLRKMDLRLLPMLSLLYLLCYLDRGSIGNAEVEGLSKTLKISPDQYNWCLTVFFFTYAAFEVPSNLLLKKLRPSRWLPTIMVAWGLVMTLMGLVQNYHGLLIARLFLGVAEAGLFPGVLYYLTMWYCSHEIQFRQALFFSAASIAGAFSGLLAFGIGKMNGVAGLEGWRWIFILEGIATVLVAFSAYFLIYDSPETASFLTEEERAFVVYRLKHQASTPAGQTEDFSWAYVWQLFSDWQVWVYVFVFWGILCPLYGISLFLPSILKNLDYSRTQAQLLTVPIYVAASIVAVLVAILSDRLGKRSPFVIGLMLMTVVGFIMCISTSDPHVVYGGVFIATCGIYSSFPGLSALVSTNLAGSYKRGAGIAFELGVGNLGGAMAANFYRKGDAPRYVLGHALELGFISTGIIAMLVIVLGYRRTNVSRARALARGEASQFTEEELRARGDKAVTFRLRVNDMIFHSRREPSVLSNENDNIGDEEDQYDDED
ncbi:hypothetical protein E4U42_006623 [Claviceps africana]|uniref:Major facilitator superfamily (MFS) profile domain-containing protein n=1 Tax=Claviceps africana TaxID=83212 RepID=A0A8K0J234_9HYPO|nr:hypothetical protein E4U42_006623 [Claviceps africana]